MNDSEIKYDYKERQKKLQDLLYRKRKEYEDREHRRVTDNFFARSVLHVPPGNYNSWKLGTRIPEYGTAIMLSMTIIGPEIFEALDYTPVYPVGDPDLKFLLDNWDNPRLDDAKNKLYESFKKEVERDEESGRIPDIKPKS
jgi:hypothetical protein